MQKINQIIRVQDDYFEVKERDYIMGIKGQDLIRRKRAEIELDLGRDFLRNGVQKFSSFSMVPNNLSWDAPDEGGEWNLYAPFLHTPSTEPGPWPVIKDFLTHIFQEQIHAGLDYFKILYMEPTWKLPILCLVSEERETGKSTFLNLIELMFGHNAITIDPEDILYSFNHHYATKNIIAIDEGMFEKKQMVEKLKHMSTSYWIRVNQKHVSQYKIPFYGKFIICSNDEQRFIKVDTQEVRFWIRKIGSISKRNVGILQDMLNEMPNFLHYLKYEHEPLNVGSDGYMAPATRNYFTLDQIRTEQLETVKEQSKTGLYHDILMRMDAWFDSLPNEHSGLNSVSFSVGELKDQFYKHDQSINLPYIRRVLTEEFKLERERGRYDQRLKDPSSPIKANGTYYTFTRPGDAPKGDDFDDLPF